MVPVISTIIHCISSFLWLCSQPVYLILCIFETNYEAISAVLSAGYSCLCYTAKALHLLVFGLLSMVESIVVALAKSEYVFRFIASAIMSLAKFLIHMSISSIQTVFKYGPWAVSSVWYGAVWSFHSLAYCIKSVSAVGVGTLAMVLEWLSVTGTFLCKALVSAGTVLITLIQISSGALTQFISAVSASITAIMTSVFEMFAQSADVLWQTEAAVGTSIWTILEFFEKKCDKIYYEIFQVISKGFGSFVDVFINFLSVVTYIAIFTVIFLVIIMVPIMFYSLYTNAMNSANTLVGLFQSTRSERNQRQRHRQRPQRNTERIPPQEGGVADADGDDSFLRPRRRAPHRRPQFRQQHVPHPQPEIFPHGPRSSQGSSGEQTQSQNTPGRSAPPPPASILKPAGRQNPDDTTARLAKQLEEERDGKLCVVCQDKAKNILILPCKHLCICLECVGEIASQPNRDARRCPLCRGHIKSYLEIYA